MRLRAHSDVPGRERAATATAARRRARRGGAVLATVLACAALLVSTLPTAPTALAGYVTQRVTVTGRFVDENGWPLAGLSLQVADPTGEVYSEATRTTKDGRFTLVASIDRDETTDTRRQVALQVWDEDFWQFTNVPDRTITVTADGTTALGTLRLQAVPTPGRSKRAVKTSSKSAVRALYRKGYAARVRREKTVKVTGCKVAATPKALQKRELGAVNTFRSLAGLEPVKLSAPLSARASKAALVQYKQGYLSHYPSGKTRCATKVGLAASAESNLSRGLVGAVNMLGYMDDPGRSNVDAGHRRWLLSPGLEKIGTGYAGSFNALHIASTQDPRNATPRWVTWPSSGWFPAELEPAGRWSFATARTDLDLSRATVKMVVGGKKVKVALRRSPVSYGYLQAVVWDARTPIVVKGAKTVTAKVTVSGIRLRGATKLAPVTYTVKMFNAAR